MRRPSAPVPLDPAAAAAAAARPLARPSDPKVAAAAAATPGGAAVPGPAAHPMRGLVKRGPRYRGEVADLVACCEAAYMDRHACKAGVAAVQRRGDTEVWHLGRWNPRLGLRAHRARALARRDADAVVAPVLAVYLEGCAGATVGGVAVVGVGLTFDPAPATRVVLEMPGDAKRELLRLPLPRPLLTLELADGSRVRFEDGHPVTAGADAAVPGDDALLGMARVAPADVRAVLGALGCLRKRRRRRRRRKRRRRRTSSGTAAT